MTKTIYTATSEYIDEMAELPEKHRVSVSGVLGILGVSRSGYQAWKKRSKRQIARLTKDLVLCHTLRNLKNL